MLKKEGYSLCITDTKASHADLTDDYAAIPAEMKEVAQYFNKEFLNEIPADDFYDKISELYSAVSNRGLLRAIHFFGENARVQKEVDALKITTSGNSLL